MQKENIASVKVPKFEMLKNIPSRSFSPGKSTRSRRGSRRSTASSRSKAMKPISINNRTPICKKIKHTSVGRPNYNNIIVLRRPEPVHLLHELRKHAPMRDRSTGLATGRACAEECVDLVKEDNAGRKAPREREHGLDQFLALADILDSRVSVVS